MKYLQDVRTSRRRGHVDAISLTMLQEIRLIKKKKGAAGAKRRRRPDPATFRDVKSGGAECQRVWYPLQILADEGRAAAAARLQKLTLPELLYNVHMKRKLTIPAASSEEMMRGLLLLVSAYYEAIPETWIYETFDGYYTETLPIRPGKFLEGTPHFCRVVATRGYYEWAKQLPRPKPRLPRQFHGGLLKEKLYISAAVVETIRRLAAKTIELRVVLEGPAPPSAAAPPPVLSYPDLRKSPIVIRAGQCIFWDYVWFAVHQMTVLEARHRRRPAGEPIVLEVRGSLYAAQQRVRYRELEFGTGFEDLVELCRRQLGTLSYDETTHDPYLYEDEGIRSALEAERRDPYAGRNERFSNVLHEII